MKSLKTAILVLIMCPLSLLAKDESFSDLQKIEFHSISSPYKVEIPLLKGFAGRMEKQSFCNFILFVPIKDRGNADIAYSASLDSLKQPLLLHGAELFYLTKNNIKKENLLKHQSFSKEEQDILCFYMFWIIKGSKDGEVIVKGTKCIDADDSVLRVNMDIRLQSPKSSDLRKTLKELKSFLFACICSKTGQISE